MSFGYKKTFSRSQKRDYAIKMAEIEKFCEENHITSSNSKSFYFTLNGQKYRVSSHTVEASNKSAYDELGRYVHPIYHEGGRREDTVYINAGALRLIEIYNDLKDGWLLDGNGHRKPESKDPYELYK